MMITCVKPLIRLGHNTAIVKTLVRSFIYHMNSLHKGCETHNKGCGMIQPTMYKHLKHMQENVANNVKALNK